MRGLLSLIVFVAGVCLSAEGQVLRPEAPSHMRTGQFIYKVPSAGGSYTDAEGALWVSTSGSGTACSQASPCSSATARSQVTAGGTIIYTSGTYAEDFTLSGANHVGITLTAPASVKNATLWTCGSTWVPAMSAIFAPSVATDCGIVSGTDNRPLWANGSLTITSNDVTLDHLRFRDSTNGTDGFCIGPVTINGTGITLTRSEFWNGCTTVGLRQGAKGVRITYSYIHNAGLNPYPTCNEIDSHGIGVYDFDGATSAATAFGSATSAPTSTSGLVVSHSTLSVAEGDGMQELGKTDGGAAERFLLQEYNHIFQNCEQGLDYKGTTEVIIRYNDISVNPFGGVSTNSAYGPHSNWWVYGNLIHDHQNFGLFDQGGGDAWMIWNNIFYRNCTSPTFNYGALNQPPSNSRVEHNVFWDNNRTGGGECAGIVSDLGGSSVLIRNNILYNNGTGSNGNIYSGSDATITNNRCYPTTPGTCGTGAETSSADDFTDKAGGDFTLVSGAQSVDAGTTLTANDANHTILIDLAGNARPFNSAFDHGAYERQSAPPSPEALLRNPWLRRAAPLQGVGIGQFLRAVVLAARQRPPQDAGRRVHDGRVRLELHDARVGLKGHGDPREVVGQPDLIAHGQRDAVAVTVMGRHSFASIAQVGR